MWTSCPTWKQRCACFGSAAQQSRGQASTAGFEGRLKSFCQGAHGHEVPCDMICPSSIKQVLIVQDAAALHCRMWAKTGSGSGTASAAGTRRASETATAPPAAVAPPMAVCRLRSCRQLPVAQQNRRCQGWQCIFSRQLQQRLQIQRQRTVSQQTGLRRDNGCIEQRQCYERSAASLSCFTLPAIPSVVAHALTKTKAQTSVVLAMVHEPGACLLPHHMPRFGGHL